MKKLVLNDFHTRHGAEWMTSKNWLIPRDYGDVKRELFGLNNHVGLLDRSYLGKVQLQGSDTIDFINRISTNDMNKLVMGTICDTVFTTPKGRIVDYCRVIRLDKKYLAISSYVDCRHLIEWLNRFLILEDVTITDGSDHYLWLTLIGPRSDEFIRSLSGQDFSGDDEHVWIHFRGIDFPAILNKNFILPAFNLCVPAAHAQDIAAWLHSELMSLGGCLIGDQAFQIIRVQSGMPDWGTELTEDYNPHEARLLDAVSFTKGCYTGQEVIARLDTYDKVQKYLMIIELQDVLREVPPLEIVMDEEKIGLLTSYAFDPLAGRSIGLGYVKKMYALDDFLLQVQVLAGDRSVGATLRIPPPVRGRK